MTIAFVNQGTTPTAAVASITGTTSVTPAAPASLVNGNIVVIYVGCKYDTASVVTPTDWTLAGSVAGGTTGTGNDTGPTRTTVFYRVKDAAWSTMPTITVTSGNASFAQAFQYSNATGFWDVAASGGADSTTGTAWSVTAASNPGITAGDMCFVATTVPTDIGAGATFSAQAITATGISVWGTATERSEPYTSNGNDAGGMVFDRPVTTGTSSAAPVITATAGGTTTNIMGTSLLVRLREITITSKSGSDSLGIGVTDTSAAPVEVDPLPSLVDGVEPEAAGSFHGPYMDSNGSLYILTEEYLAAGGPGFGNHPMIMKSADNGATWTRMDAANGPGYNLSGSFNDLESVWLVQRAGTNSLIVLHEKASSRWWGHTYRTSDHPTNPDTWDAASFGTSSGLEQFTTAPPSESGIGGVTLSDGTVRAFIRGNKQSTFDAIRHAVMAAGGVSWNIAGATYITHANVNMSRPTPVVGESDNTYMFYRDHTNGRVYYVTISSTGTVSGATRVDSGGAGAGATTKYENNVVPPVYYDDAGTPVVVVGFVNASDQLRTVEIRGGSVGSEQVVSTDTVTVNPQDSGGSSTDNQGPSAALAVLGTTVYALWGDNTSGDLYYSTRANGGSWSARTLLNDTGASKAVHWTYANVVTRPGGDKYLSYTYDIGPHADDDSDIMYDDLLISAGATPITGSESTAITVADSSSLVITEAKSASDSAAITITDTSAPQKAFSSTDTATISVAESVAIQVTQSTTDTTAITVADTSSVLISETKSASDTAAINIADASALSQTNAVPGNETVNISVDESVALFKTIPVTDTGSLAVAETAANAVAQPAVDTAAISVSDTSAVLKTLVTSDTASIAVADTSAVAVTITATDTSAITVTETATIFRALSAVDTTAITVVDSSASALSVSTADSGALSVNDVGSASIAIATSDTGALSVSEVANVASSVPGTETVAIGVAETVSTFVTVSATDTSALSVAEATATTNFVNTTDAGSISVTETAVVFQTRSATDTAAITVTDASAGITGVNTLSATDTAAITVTEARNVSVFVTSTDSATVAVTEAVGQAGSQPGTDAAAISVTETAVVFQTRTATDAASISVADTSALAILAPKSASDTTALTVTESPSILVGVQSADISALSVSESVSENISVNANDAAAVSVNESATIAVTFTRTDTAAISVTESAQVAIGVESKSANDTGALGVAETTAQFVILFAFDQSSIAAGEGGTAGATTAVAADTVSLSVVETAQVNVSLLGTDDLSVALVESSALFFSKSSLDTLTLTVVEFSDVFARTVDRTFVFVYQNGAWVEGTAVVWKNGAWHPTLVYARKNGAWVDNAESV